MNVHFKPHNRTNNGKLKVTFYTYYSSPWQLLSGDDVRIHAVAKSMNSNLKSYVVVYNLSHLVEKMTTAVKDNVIYVAIPRSFYQIMAKLLKWNQHYDLNPLIKLTHYIDEFIVAVKLVNILRRARVLYVFGSMSLFSFFMRLLQWEGTITYDPLANYAQTLYLHSRYNIIELIRYGLYLALHKLQLKYSDYIVYPSKVDLKNARRMFNNIENATIIPNPTPICYESIKEYEELRRKRENLDKPYFILIAGGKGKANEEAVKTTIEIFNELPPNTFQLYITGPWQDMQGYVANPSIRITGTISHEKLKELLTISDYGLSPVFSHVAGTFLKVLGYLAASLDIIVTLRSLMGIDLSIIKEKKLRVFIIHNKEDYRVLVHNLIKENYHIRKQKVPTLCH